MGGGVSFCDADFDVIFSFRFHISNQLNLFLSELFYVCWRIMVHVRINNKIT